MKTIDTIVLADHLDQQVTGLVTCWIIEREDGQVYRFTDATDDIVVDRETYSSVGAYKRTAIETTSSLSVDNLEVVGIASELALPEQDLRNGLFDNARISVFMAAWSSVVPGKIRLRRGFFGEVQTLPNGTFQVELRGLMQRLAYNYTDIFSPTCLYDLGEPACGIVIQPDQVQRNTVYSLGDAVTAAQSNATSLGLRYPFDIPDASFEDLAVNGFEESLNWYDSGANPMTTNGVTTYSDGSSLKGPASGAGSVTQIIDLSTVDTFPQTLVTDFSAAMRLRGHTFTSGDTSQVTLEFLDEDHEVTYLNQSARSTQSQNYTGIPGGLTGDFTCSFWIKPDSNSGGGLIAGGTELGDNAGSQFFYANQRIEFDSQDPLFSSILETNAADNTPRVPIGQWTHIAVTRIGGNTRMYVNFDLVFNTNYVWSTFFFDTLFGEYTPQFGSEIVFDNGALNDIRIYNVGKTQDELILEMQQAPTLPDATLLRWFPFDDSTINDRTGNDATSPGAGTGVTYELASTQISGVAGDITTGWNSGAMSPGAAWTEFDSTAVRVPSNTKMVRITAAASGPNAFVDDLTALIYDISQPDPVYLPSDVNNVYWECTTAGLTGPTYPATYIGGAGATATDGTATFTARNAFLRSGKVIQADDRRTFSAVVSDARAVDGWFNGGSVIFATGANAGVVMEVKEWDAFAGGGNVELFLSVPNQIDTDDEFFIYPGCDKSRISCAAIFRNIINFFGFPDIPGQDELYRYPDAKE